MLTIKGLTVKYESKVAINNLNIELECTKVHGIIGLNGSGKTTFLNALYGFIKTTDGTFLYKDKLLTRAQMSYLESENYFYSNITGLEYLKLFMYYNPQFKIEAWEKIFQLPLNTLIENYSTGMKKKLALLAIIVIDKEIIILDEPFMDSTLKVFIFCRKYYSGSNLLEKR